MMPTATGIMIGGVGCELPVQSHQVDSITIDRLVAVTCHFNPCGYRRNVENYYRFAAGLQAVGVELWTIELAFGDDPFELAESPRNFRVRGGSRNLLWQKERLLNLLIAELPDDVDAIAWIDADILFLNPSWPQLAREFLSHHHVAQLYTESHHSKPDGRLHDARLSTGYAYIHDRNHFSDFSKSHPGFAWVGRAKWLRDIGLLETHVTGGGDALMISGFTGTTPRIAYNMNDQWQALTNRWSRATFDAVGGSFGCIDGAIVHLFHGTRENRRYMKRWNYLTDHDFDPAVDVEIDDSGLLAWTDQAVKYKPQMIQQVAGYFGERREDDSV